MATKEMKGSPSPLSQWLPKPATSQLPKGDVRLRETWSPRRGCALGSLERSNGGIWFKLSRERCGLSRFVTGCPSCKWLISRDRCVLSRLFPPKIFRCNGMKGELTTKTPRRGKRNEAESYMRERRKRRLTRVNADKASQVVDVPHLKKNNRGRPPLHGSDGADCALQAVEFRDIAA